MASKWLIPSLLVVILIVTCASVIALRHGEALPLAFDFLNHIVTVVGDAVQSYFVTFQSCWALTGGWFVTMILGYFELLATVVAILCAFPTVVVLVVGLNCALFWVWCIVRDPCNAARNATPVDLDDLDKAVMLA